MSLPQSDSHSMKLWYYEADGSQKGPVDADTLQTLIRDGVVTRSTQIWSDGMPAWVRAGSIQGLFTGPPPLESSSPRSDLAPSQSPAERKHLNTHMAWSVIVTLFCCLPIGIVAIVNASKVSGALASGDYAEAERLAGEAKKWADWAFALGLVLGFVYFMTAIIG